MAKSAHSLPPALVFDLDGTLVDSVHDIAAALNRVLGESGRPALSVAAVGRMVGDGAALLVERGFAATGGPAADMPVMLDRFLALYERAAADRTVAFPGVVATLDALHRGGTVLGVCTNKPVRATHVILRALGLGGFFAAVIGGDSCAARKPDPAPLRAALQEMGVDSDAAVMVGDSANDVGAARAAGIPVICMRYGYARVPAAELGADLLLDRFEDVPAAAARLAASAGGAGS